MRCKDCNIIGCPNRGSNAVFSKPCTIINQDSFDWQSFRAEAANGILCAMIASPSIIKLKDDKGNLIEFCKEDACKVSIEYADELIKQLKEKEEK